MLNKGREDIMKKKTKIISILLAAILIIAMAAGCAEREQAEQNEEKEVSKDTKILVVYFSWSGHLNTMAHWIADETGGDIVRVLAKDEYPKDYDETTDRAKKEQEDGTRPEITLDLTAKDLKKYDTVFFGFPVWWYDLPMPMYTFLESADLSGKTVIPFFSHEGSSDGADSLPNLKKLAKKADVKTDDALSIQGTEVDSAEKEVKDWVKKLGYSK